MIKLPQIFLTLSQCYFTIVTKINLLQPLALITARFYVAWVFFASGLTKLNDWDSTLFLFEEEYAVPLLPYELAAYLGTAAELILPILLAAGFASRFAAAGLFVVNIVAVISLEDIAAAAYIQHVLWGVLLAQIVIFSAGRFSIDHLIKLKVLSQKSSSLQ